MTTQDLKRSFSRQNGWASVVDCIRLQMSLKCNIQAYALKLDSCWSHFEGFFTLVESSG